MPFWKRRRAEEEVEADAPHYERPVQATSLSKADERKLATLRKKAQAAARRAARESERAREAARRVRAASGPDGAARTQVAEPESDVPSALAGAERPKVLAKKEQRRLDRLRRKASKAE